MPLNDTIQTIGDSTALTNYPELDTLAIEQWAAEAKALREKKIADSIASLPPPPPAWKSGLAPESLPLSAASDSLLSATIVAMILAVFMGFGHCRHLLRNLGKELSGMRSRSKNFDEHTSGESRLIVLFAVQFCVYGGMLLQSAAAFYHGVAPFASGFGVTLTFMLLTAAWYLFELGIVRTVCYAFATPEQTHQMMRGLSASQVVTGFLFIIPAVVLFFYPDAAYQMLLTASVLYIVMRIIYLYKGFRIFYTKMSDLVYFILYLCALEIIPVLIVLAVSFKISV